jgi:hypothetical protein
MKTASSSMVKFPLFQVSYAAVCNTWQSNTYTVMWQIFYGFDMSMPFIGAFVKLWKALPSFVLPACTSVRMSVRMQQLCSQWKNFHEISYLNIFENLSRKLKNFFKMWQDELEFYVNTNVHFWWYLVQFFLEWKPFFGQNCGENQNTYFMYNNFVFFFSKIVSCMR